MRKSINILTVLLVSVLSFAGLSVAEDVLSRTVFNASGSAPAVAIKAASGTPVAASFNASLETNATLTVYRPDRKGRVLAAVSADTNLLVRSSTSGAIGGATPTTSDIVLIATSASGTVYRGIAAVSTNGANTNAYIQITVDAPINVASNETCYVAVDGNKLQIPLLSSGHVGLNDLFSGYAGYPLYLSLPATAGSAILSGVIERRD